MRQQDNLHPGCFRFQSGLGGVVQQNAQTAGKVPRVHSDTLHRVERLQAAVDFLFSHGCQLGQQETAHLGDSHITQMDGCLYPLSDVLVKARVQLGQGGPKFIQFSFPGLFRQPCQQILVVVTERPHLPLNRLQIPLVELLLGNDVPLDFHLPGGVQLLGQVNDQPHRQPRHHQHKRVVGNQIFRMDSLLQKRECLHSRLQAKEEQGHAALDRAVLQQKAEPAPEAEPVQKRGGDQRHSAIDGDQRHIWDLAVQKQYLGQAGRGHLEHARHARGGKGVPEPGPPRPPNPQGTHQQDGAGERTVADHIVVGKARIQNRIQQGGQ